MDNIINSANRSREGPNSWKNAYVLCERPHTIRPLGRYNRCLPEDFSENRGRFDHVQKVRSYYISLRLLCKGHRTYNIKRPYCFQRTFVHLNLRPGNVWLGRLWDVCWGHSFDVRMRRSLYVVPRQSIDARPNIDRHWHFNKTPSKMY